MSAWVLSIVGVICLGVLLEILLPEGQTSKYVKGAFSLLVIFVVIAPLPKLIKSAPDFNLSGIDFKIDQSFIDDTAAGFVGDAERETEDYLVLGGYDTEVTIVVKKGTLSDIERIEILLKLTVLEAEDVNTHISRVKELASARLGIDPKIIDISTILKGDDGLGSD